MKKAFHYLILIISASLLIGCKQSIKISNTKANKIKLLDSVKNKEPDTAEYIDWWNSTINGIAHPISLTKNLYRALGNPESISHLITNIAGYYPNRTFKYTSIKDCKFELYGDTAVLKSLDFTKSNLKFITQNTTLDGNSTLTSLVKIYPDAVKHQSKLYDKDEEFDAIDLPVTKPIMAPLDDRRHWVLLFKKDKLVELDYYGN